MPLTVSGSLSDPATFGRIVKRDGRRAVSTKLRQQGIAAGNLARQYANSDLGPSRQGKRRRDHGVSYRNGFDPPIYTGLDDFESGIMQVRLRNRSKHARVLEVGARRHAILPKNKKALAWPGIEHPVPAVDHPGFTGKKILQRAANDAMNRGFVGQSLGHASINVRITR